MKINLVVLLIWSTAFTSNVNANILNDLIGTWRTVTTTVENGREVSTVSREVVTRLPGGIIYTVETERIFGKDVTVARRWRMPGGKGLAVAYDEKGSTKAISETTATVRGNTIHSSGTAETLQGKVTGKSSATRVNSNRWTGESSATFRGKSVSYKYLSTRTR